MFKTQKEFIEAMLEGRKFKTPSNILCYYEEGTYLNPFRVLYPSEVDSEGMNGIFSDYASMVEVKPIIDWSKVPLDTPVIYKYEGMPYTRRFGLYLPEVDSIALLNGGVLKDAYDVELVDASNVEININVASIKDEWLK